MKQRLINELDDPLASNAVNAPCCDCVCFRAAHIESCEKESKTKYTPQTLVDCGTSFGSNNWK